MKNRWAKRRELQRLLAEKTWCVIQHTGWPCNTCFHNMDLGISNNRLHELWLSTLLIRGDYTKEEIPQDDATLSKNVDQLIDLLKRNEK